MLELWKNKWGYFFLLHAQIFFPGKGTDIWNAVFIPSVPFFLKASRWVVKELFINWFGTYLLSTCYGVGPVAGAGITARNKEEEASTLKSLENMAAHWERSIC